MEKRNYKIMENNGMIEYVRCDFCNSINYQIILRSRDFIFNVIQRDFTIVKCLNCNLVYTNPRLKEKELIKYYSKIVSYDNRPASLNQKHRFNLFLRKDILVDFFNYPFFEKKKVRKLIQYPNYLRVIKRQKKTQFIPNYIKDGNILEIGCSYGYYIYQLKSLGWNVKGIELNKEAVDFAINNLNLDVECKRIEDFESGIYFDIIYLNMVLEHVASPKIVLQKCHSLLKEKGLLIFSIPDFSGIEVRIYKDYAYGLQLPFHLYHFTPYTIKNYLKELKFKKIKIVHQIFDRDLIAPLFFISRDNPDKQIVKFLFKLLSIKFIRKTFVRILIIILGLIGKTSRMTVIVEKSRN
jgi:2-polyprenyl-3-methyl-5-hydroxy-6-metoxy-1,4-benzoquinol methylase